MDTLKRIPICDITTFEAPIFSKGKKKRISNGQLNKDMTIAYIKSKPQKKRFLIEDPSSDEDYKPEKKIKSKPKKFSEDDDVADKSSSFENAEEENSDEDYDSIEETFKPKKKKTRKLSTDKDYASERKYEQESISEYEKMVQKNREEKIAFIESLKINEIRESLSESVKSLQAKPKRKSFIAVKRPPPPRSPIALRKSSRLSKENVDLSTAAIIARAKAEIKERQRLVQKKFPEVLKFSTALTGDDLYEDFVNDFRGLDHGNTKPFHDYVSHFREMQLPTSQIAKVVYSRITSMAFHPMREKIFVAAASKYGKIGFWNVNSDSNPYVFELHTGGITNLKFNPYHPHLVVSSSYDGTLRCGDLESSVFNEVYNVSEETSCTHFDFLSANTYLVAQQNGNVSVVDHRTRMKASGKKHRCHDYSVKSVSVHPLDKSYFLSADNKGTIRLWDLRKLQAQPIVEVQHHKRCIQSAFFSPLTGKSVLTTSSDDTICLFDSSKLGKSILHENTMRHNNQTGRWLTTFRATWLPNTDDAFVVGSMLHPRRIEVYNDRMNNIFNFTHENLGCITSVNTFHPSLPVLAGANSSGKVYVFSDGGFQ